MHHEKAFRSSVKGRSDELCGRSFSLTTGKAALAIRGGGSAHPAALCVEVRPGQPLMKLWALS